mmetsp:Transcript_107727/g.304755  ORF Transcript_107727/g.304755 Transcript_107727/m.304755 type:complete len:215 (+) Transcript_107727:245-889(+)
MKFGPWKVGVGTASAGAGNGGVGAGSARMSGAASGAASSTSRAGCCSSPSATLMPRVDLLFFFFSLPPSPAHRYMAAAPRPTRPAMIRMPPQIGKPPPPAAAGSTGGTTAALALLPVPLAAVLLAPASATVGGRKVTTAGRVGCSVGGSVCGNVGGSVVDCVVVGCRARGSSEVGGSAVVAEASAAGVPGLGARVPLASRQLLGPATTRPAETF